ncbi:MAG: hypothetical protein NVSMB64_08730 [Candidatus Velthaea sp.]
MLSPNAGNAAQTKTLSSIVQSSEGAQKTTLLKHALTNCITGLGTGVAQSGFAVINATAATIIAETYLSGAPPNAKYTVSVDQTPSSAGCVKPLGTLVTNAQGIGDLQVTVPRVAGTKDALVILRPANAAAQTTGEIDSRDVVFAAK